MSHFADPNRPIDMATTSIDDRFTHIWNAEHRHLVALAGRMLTDPAEANDVVQEAFMRLAVVDPDELEDPKAWMIVVVRRLCLDRIKSAHSRYERATADDPATDSPSGAGRVLDPADRVTLDDQVQMALGVVLDRLTPAERTVFVLHDVFGFSFVAVGEIVGRTATACRQLASRGRRSIRADTTSVRRSAPTTRQRELADRFISACAGGDLAALMALLDPEIVGDARLIGGGSLVHLAGRPAVAHRLLGLFGQDNGLVMISMLIDDAAAVAVRAGDRVIALMRLDESNGLIRHIHSFVQAPATRRGGPGRGANG